MNKPVLHDAAYDLADEIRRGKWNHIAEIQSTPVPRIAELVAELRRRVPGHSDDEYQKALAQGMFESLW